MDLVLNSSLKSCRKRLSPLTCTNLLLSLWKFIRMRYNGVDWRFLQWRNMPFSEFLWNVWYSGPCFYTSVTHQAVAIATPHVCPMATRRNLSVFFAPNMCLRRQIFNVVCRRSAFWLLRSKLTEDQHNLGAFLKFLDKFMSMPSLTPKQADEFCVMQNREAILRGELLNLPTENTMLKIHFNYHKYYFCYFTKDEGNLNLIFLTSLVRVQAFDGYLWDFLYTPS